MISAMLIALLIAKSSIAFDIQKIGLRADMYEIPATAELYNEIKDHMPETEISRIDLQIKEAELKLAKSGYYPKLSLHCPPA